MLRERTRYDRSAVVLFIAASMAMGATAANVDAPRTNPWMVATTGSSNAVPRVTSPQRQFEEQWDSLIDVIGHFEPSVQNAPESMTPYVFLAVDDAGRVAAHHTEFRLALERDPIPSDELRSMFAQHLAQPAEVVPTYLQVRLGAARVGSKAAMIVLGINAKATPLNAAAPSLDLAAIRRDRNWMQQSLSRRTDNERRIIGAADPRAIDPGLPSGTELWVVLSPDGRYVRSGQRSIITDPNDSRTDVQKIISSARIGDVARGTAVTDTSGDRVQVTWHWLQSE